MPATSLLAMCSLNCLLFFRWHQSSSDACKQPPPSSQHTRRLCNRKSHQTLRPPPQQTQNPYQTLLIQFPRRDIKIIKSSMGSQLPTAKKGVPCHAMSSYISTTGTGTSRICPQTCQCPFRAWWMIVLFQHNSYHLLPLVS